VASGSVTTTKPAILPTMATPTARPLITNPFSTLFAAISDASEGEITVTWIWIFMAAVVTEMLIVVILAKFQNQLLAGGVGIFALAVAMIMGIFDWVDVIHLCARCGSDCIDGEETKYIRRLLCLD